jgi:uncharacterized membrane protein
VRSNRAAIGLTALLTFAGLTHFVNPGFYDPIVPHALPGRDRWWTWASGVAELGCAAAVASLRTRRAGALAAAVLFVAVFPANIQMAIDWRDRAVAERLLAYGRLPLQVPLVVWAWRVRRDAYTRAGVAS